MAKQNKQQQEAAQELAVESGQPEPAEPVAATTQEVQQEEGGVRVKVTRPQGWFFGGALHPYGTVLEVPGISVDEAFVEKA